MADTFKSPRETDSDLSIPPDLKRKLESFQQRLWSVKIAEGALAGLFGLGISYLLVFGLDRFVDTPEWLRATALILGFAVPAVGLPVRWRRWVWKQRSLEQVARVLRRKYPRLGDELLGIVELARSPSQGNSRVLVEAAMKQVDERITDEEFDDAVPRNHYATWLTSALAVIALVGLLLFLVSDAARNTLARWASPWKGIDRYTFAQLEPLPEKAVVPYAENFNLTPELAGSTEWRPNNASVRLPGNTRLFSSRTDERYPFDVPPQKENGTLSLRVGDMRQKIEVEPLPRPELTELNAVIRLPDYLRYDHDPVIPVRGGSVSVVKGAKVGFSATASRELASAEANGAPATIDEASFSTTPAAVEESLKQTFSWRDIHGLQAKAPVELEVNPVEDAAPDVFANPVTTEQVVLVDETISFDISGVDDFGIRELGLSWHGVEDGDRNPEPAVGEKTVASGSPEKLEIQSRGTFSAAREGVAPQTIQIRAFAQDYLPDRERSFSPTFVLHVLSAEDHAQWLTDEFGKWFRNAREVYENEQQLYETNLDLRGLPADELDRPENRRRLQEQSSAESSNARRLDALTKSGRDLVRQATKNDEFEAERLESWATMMRSLDDIAKNRMPSVSDLLQQASRASGAEPGEESAETPEEAGSGPQVSNREGNENPSDPEAKSEEGSETPATPGISDQESSLTENEEKPDKPESEKPAGAGALGLPATSLAAAREGEEAETEPETPAQEELDSAVTEQKGLLEEFAKVADQLQEILSSLEASTFVKRFKAASRKQFDIASTLNKTLDAGFGLPRHRIEQQLRKVGEETATKEDEESRSIYQIQTDLEAYFQRKQDLVFKNVLEQMKSLSVVSSIKEIGEETLINLNGRSISAAEYWGDTLDRWAEELVSASECQSSEGGSKDSLPPEIVLEIMKILKEEMELRDETREMDAARPALAPDVYESKVRPLELTQADLRERADGILADIQALPDAAQHFRNEVKLLTVVSDVMREARAVLARPDTGAEAVAAETEVIELLLQAQRQNPSGGGGGGGGNPGGGGTAGGSAASLTDIGPGGESDGTSAPLDREVDQSTGKAGRELPEEFRRGLDTYFNAIESN
ncbi:MAG: hypothetical protein WD342_09395 [Verrucomicrobiales bacterium]